MPNFQVDCQNNHISQPREENFMNWEQKLAKLQELKSKLLRMLSPGNWQCSVPGEIGGDGMLRGDFGRGSTAPEAVSEAYDLVVNLHNNKYIVTTGWSKPRKCYRLYNDNWVQVVSDL